MKKNIFLTCLCRSVLVLLMLLTLTGCSANYVTIGSLEKCDSTKAAMSYREFDGVKEYNISTNGENLTIQVEIETYSGSLDIYIVEKGGKKEDAVYEGNDVMSSSFDVTVPKEGTYTIHLKADHHEGSYCFQISDDE